MALQNINTRELSLHLKSPNSIRYANSDQKYLISPRSFFMAPTSPRCEISSFPNRGESLISVICFLAFCYLCTELHTSYDVPADLAFMIFILPIPFWFVAMTNSKHDCERTKDLLDIEAQKSTEIVKPVRHIRESHIGR